MMKEMESVPNESQLHLDAMLFLLDDPALDRKLFEDRLLDNPQLGEILADAVGVLHELRSFEFERATVPAVQEARPASHNQSVIRQMLFVPAVAAAVLIACYVGWQSIEIAKTNQSSSPLVTGVNGVVLAWGELQSENDLFDSAHENFESDFVAPVSVTDSFAESDVPDWLVLAATNTSDGHDIEEDKVFLQ